MPESEDYDFIGLRENSGVRRLLQANGEELSDKRPIYSDEIIRINSREERKVRVLLITHFSFYILIQKNATEYSLKTKYVLNDIYSVQVVRNNSLLINVKFNTK